MAEKLEEKLHIKHAQIVTMYLVAFDIIAVSGAYFLALLLRFDFRFSTIPEIYFDPWLKFAPLYAGLCIIVFWVFKLYKSIWRFASFTELQRITLATVVTTFIHIIGVTIAFYFVAKQIGSDLTRMPFSYYCMGPLIQFTFVVGIRFAYRYILLLRSNKTDSNLSHVMLIGMHSIIGTT